MPIRDRLEKLYEVQIEIDRIENLLRIDPSAVVETELLKPDLIAVMRQVARSKQKPIAMERRNSGVEEACATYDDRFMAIAEYVLKHDIASFRRNMAKAASNQLQVLKYYDAGTLYGDGSVAAMGSLYQLFDALAAADFQLAEEFARRMGGRDKVEKMHDSRFRHALGYLLKYTVMNDVADALPWLESFRLACLGRGLTAFRGYVRVFQGILEHDAVSTNEGLQAVASGHVKLARNPSWYLETEDELLCVWGIGLANLARHRGLRGDAISPYIPEDLLVEQT